MITRKSMPMRIVWILLAGIAGMAAILSIPLIATRQPQPQPTPATSGAANVEHKVRGTLPDFGYAHRERVGKVYLDPMLNPTVETLEGLFHSRLTDACLPAAIVVTIIVVATLAPLITRIKAGKAKRSHRTAAVVIAAIGGIFFQATYHVYVILFAYLYPVSEIIVHTR